LAKSKEKTRGEKLKEALDVLEAQKQEAIKKAKEARGGCLTTVLAIATVTTGVLVLLS
jgi:hypothetical protein